MKSRITKIKNSIEEFNSKFEQAEVKISKIDDRIIGIIEFEEQKKIIKTVNRA